MKSIYLATVLLVLVSATFAAPNPRYNPTTREKRRRGSSSWFGRRSLQPRDSCPVPEDVAVVAPKANPFVSLSQDEIDSVAMWLHDPAQGLNLTNTSSATISLSDNYIWHVDVLKPNKSDVLSYLDASGVVPRYARVTLIEGGREVPIVGEYSVGPLPISNSTRKEALDNIYNGPNGAKLLWSAGPVDSVRRAAIDSLMNATLAPIADLTNDLLEMAFYGSSDSRSTMIYFMQSPASTDGEKSVFWSPFRRNGMEPWDQPSDLYIQFDITGTDASQWRSMKVVYNLEVYDSVQAFYSAWKAGNVTKTSPPATNIEFLYKNKTGSTRELEDRMAPTVLSLDGNRFKVDKEEQYIEYLGWTFYMRFDYDVGVQFYDIRFRGERIMYELSLQDAIAQYAGNNPFQAGTAYMDRFYGIGAASVRLIPGYDCPYHAAYLNGSYATTDQESYSQTNSICIFETDIGTPITRHMNPVWSQATKGSKLIVRMIATVGNYDYLWDYGFYVDGTISVDAHASGYIQANYYRPDDEGRWGPRVAETIAGTLHTHVMNFKADFDLVDEKNSLVKTEIVVENVTQPWFDESFEMMRYNISDVETEDDGLMDLPANGQTMFTVVNKDHTNKWGQPRGYRILPGLSNVVLASKSSPFFRKSGQFAKQPIAVSRQHDSEPASSATLNQNVPDAPLVEFWKFFNGESLVQEDLVAWVNLGMHHYTRSEDIPNTLMSEAHSNIFFAPQNWGDTELTKDLANSVMMYAEGADNEIVIETNGVEPPSCLNLGPEDSLLGVFTVSE
ncbi:hypothetical protein DPSP01_007759 [Paraphaeosphaeria sporulosa]